MLHFTGLLVLLLSAALSSRSNTKNNHFIFSLSDWNWVQHGSCHYGEISIRFDYFWRGALKKINDFSVRNYWGNYRSIVLCICYIVVCCHLIFYSSNSYSPFTVARLCLLLGLYVVWISTLIANKLRLKAHSSPVLPPLCVFTCLFLSRTCGRSVLQADDCVPHGEASDSGTSQGCLGDPAGVPSTGGQTWSGLLRRSLDG